MTRLASFICVTFTFLLLLTTLSESLWIDEILTVWTAQGTPAQVIDKVITFQGQTPLYYLILNTIIHLLGSTEWILRLPSLLALLVTLCIVAKICAVTEIPESNLLAMLALLTFPGVLRAAVYARPYALALLCAALATYFFISWFKTQRTRMLVSYAIITVVMGYLHYYFLLLPLAQACFIIRFASIRKYRPFWRAFVAIGVCLLPMVYQIQGLLDRAPTLTSPYTTSLNELGAAFFPGCIVATLIILIIRRKELHSPYNGLWIITYFIPPTLLFLFSSVHGSDFLPRYYLVASIAGALALATVSARWRWHTALTLLVGIVAVFQTYTAMDRSLHPEGWREAHHYLSSLAGSSSNLHLFSGIVELRTEDLFKNPTSHPYLVAPATLYALPSIPTLLPYPRGESFELEWYRNFLATIATTNTEVRIVLKNEFADGGTTLAQLKEIMNESTRHLLEERCFGAVCILRYGA
jgi:4-amino-4-deoxy-L-arabinose transferase-like glycosyltransferase